MKDSTNASDIWLIGDHLIQIRTSRGGWDFTKENLLELNLDLYICFIEFEIGQLEIIVELLSLCKWNDYTHEELRRFIYRAVQTKSPMVV